MSWHPFRRAQRFRREERGSATVEFAIWFPFLFLFMYSTFELGLLTARNAMLERGLDIAVRDIRLGTGAVPQHDEIKTSICENAIVIPGCESNLRLEMLRTDMRNWASLPADPDCTDRAEEARPVRQFTPGTSNQLMLLRACLKVQPLSPTSQLVDYMQTDAAGDIAIVVTSAFVQEP
ncbi:MAG: TadE/TadG family type IV pilus assembly protein [Rhodosalinus sp.]|uniref:TadE/TadG family type IV pilus assembly protein n=1 Tax=Rhodosalinus sp. TaxID=2047741 RepID=UPI003979F97B